MQLQYVYVLSILAPRRCCCFVFVFLTNWRASRRNRRRRRRRYLANLLFSIPSLHRIRNEIIWYVKCGCVLCVWCALCKCDVDVMFCLDKYVNHLDFKRLTARDNRFFTTFLGFYKVSILFWLPSAEKMPQKSECEINELRVECAIQIVRWIRLLNCESLKCST